MSLSPPTPERHEEDELRPFPVFEAGEIEPHPPKFRQTENHSALIVYLRGLPLMTPKCARLVADQDPRRIMTNLFGPVGQEFIDGIGEVSAQGYGFDADSDWSDVFYYACQVMSTNPRHFFNKLETPEEYQGAPCSREYACELDYLKKSDARVDRPFDIFVPLLASSGSFVLRRRAEWSAALIKIIHLVVDVFRPSMRQFIGSKAAAMARFKKYMKEIVPYNNPQFTLARFVTGDVFGIDTIIYETLLHIAMPEIHMSNLTGTLNLLWLAEYHSVRCAYDASSSSTLYVCLMNPSYFVDVWYPYMRMHFPCIFNCEEDSSENVNAFRASSQPSSWKHLIFYLPSPHQHCVEDANALVEYMRVVFTEVLTPDFFSSFLSISGPPNYEELWKGATALFVPHVEPKVAVRRSKRSTAPPLSHSVEKRKCR